MAKTNKIHLNHNEKILLLGILHYILAVFLVLAKLLPFDVLEQLQISEQTFAVLLLNSIVTGSALYLLSSPN